MKIFKFRLRSFALLTLVLTLTLFLLNLSPSAVSQHFFRVSATHGLPSANNQSKTEPAGALSKRVYSDPFKEYDLRVSQAASQGEKDAVNSSRQGAGEGGPGDEAAQEDAKNQREPKGNDTGDPGDRTGEKQERNPSSRNGEASKTNSSRRIDEAGGSYVRQGIADGEEHDSYVQDYPDYTPAEFVEVLKTKLSSRVKKPARISGKGRDARPPPNEKFSREVLKERALGFPEKSPLRKFLTEQERRVSHVRATCPHLAVPNTSFDSRGPPPGLVDIHNLIFDRINLLTFCPVYKAASTSWTITLLEIGGYKRAKNIPLQKLVSQVYPKISNLAGPAVARRTTKFMIVRHPFERLLSCFRDKFEYGKKSYYYKRYGEKMVRRYREFPKYISEGQLGLLQEQVRNKVMAGLPVVLRNNPFASPVGPTFLEFVQYVVDVKFEDEHWRTYYSHCSPCLMDYDFVLRFESLYQEGKQFLEYLNRTSQVQPRWDNPTSGGATNSEIVCSYYSQLPFDLMQKLADKYENDFLLFEYKPDSYFECAKDFVPGKKGT
ncbi:carbohydrate sulfotransferase 12-like [Penaeus indicus]|uniref:carbohydrate sulfotransferase 12-like n=1 Tax=Penaeus indicus TaxID=29960 RepID=UPI00300BFE9A